MVLIDFLKVYIRAKSIFLSHYCHGIFFLLLYLPQNSSTYFTSLKFTLAYPRSNTPDATIKAVKYSAGL